MMTEPTKAGMKLREWLKVVSFSRSKYYTLPDHLRPHSVDIEGMRIITELPAAWLERMAASRPPALTEREAQQSAARAT